MRCSSNTESNLFALSCLSLAVLFVLSGCGSNQPSGISPPKAAQAASTMAVGQASLGYIWGAGGNGIRQVRGVTGASYFGPPVYADFKDAVTSGNARHALAIHNNGDIALLRLPETDAQDLAPAIAPTEHMVLSPSGTNAVVYADTPNILLINGLPDTPKVQTISAASVGLISAAVVSDNGALLLENRSNSGVRVFSLSSDGTPTSLTSVTSMGGMTFLKSRDDALVADNSQNVVWLITGIGQNPTMKKVAGATDGVNQPVAVSASSDRRWAVIANGQSHSIVRVDLSRQKPAVTAECACIPSELSPLAGNAVFRLNPGSSVPVWVFDGDAPTPKIVSIPAPAAPETAAN